MYNELVRNDLPAARKAVSRIVGRDTQNLTAEGVTKAAVETVAENASDGVIAPLLYMLIGGAPLALTYKAINTMDSMLGYKNEKYLYFGRAAAKLDDVANYIPSRLAALLWVAAGDVVGHIVQLRGCAANPQPPCRPFVGGGCGLYRQRCQGCMAYLAAGPAQSRQPQQCPDRKRLRRCTGGAAGRPGLLFWRILPQVHHRRCPAPH